MAESRSEPDGIAPAARDIPALTGLRFFLALWVLSYHTEQTITPAKGYVPVMHDGYLGVDVFFIISGFILAHVYGARFAAREPGVYRRFLWLRLARVYPAYATALGVTAVIELIRAGFGSGVFIIDPKPWSWELVRHFAMVQSWGLADFFLFNLPGWSLSAEWAAYLAFPLVLLLARILGRPAFRAVAIAAGFAALYAAFHRLGYPDLDKPGDDGMARLAAEFFAGVALRLMAAPGRVDPRLGDAVAVGATVVALVLLSTWGHDHPLEGDVLTLPLFVLIVWGCAQDGPLLNRLLGNRLMLFLGGASYSIYLIQSPVDEMIELSAGRLGFGQPAYLLPIALLSGAAAIVAGCLLFVIVERPARALLRRLG